MSEEERSKILAQTKKERLETTHGSQTRHAKVHNVDTYVDFDSIIDSAVMHGVESTDDDKGPTGTEGNTDLLAYMAGQQSSSGDIHQVLAAKWAPDKQKKLQVNESKSAKITMKGDTYYFKVIFVPRVYSVLVKDDQVPQRILYHNLLNRENV
jgi:hypothetical protein